MGYSQNLHIQIPLLGFTAVPYSKRSKFPEVHCNINQSMIKLHKVKIMCVSNKGRRYLYARFSD